VAKFPKEAMGGSRGKDARTTYPRAFTIYDADLELVKWMADELGCSRSEIVRTAIRNMAMRMHAVELVMAAEGRAEL
jgi:hypothetical protein